MKARITILAVLTKICVIGQTITYNNFSKAINDTISVNLAENNSFSPTLKTTTGSSVIWNASNLLVKSGTPIIHFSYSATTSTPYASLYPNSNYSFYDPALTAFLGYDFVHFNSDSVISWGTYEPSSSHEIFQNPDKKLIFPFTYGQSFTDTYAKTNYSNATTISSYQVGTRTVTFSGFGTLILPQGTFTNVALVTELRTNNLGPNSYEYTWYNISNGKKLLLRTENGSSINTAFCNSLPTGISKLANTSEFSISPNPAATSATLNISSILISDHLNLTIYNLLGEKIYTSVITSNKHIINRNGLDSGIYIYTITTKANETLSIGKLIFK
ncbi:MAG: T9SS C-terminal target domain-containing protein [Bacteroidetes bacterium]|nr:MAG: T9SS C-terminal target domain-containing protein [Bacteroidota bacterium]MBL1145338.1 T9SS C-terminal target domain-containing protein [Bacteroidota bacterium]NOG58136.1 T9SS type A sorting domain-containing protein [Bacteroidota bacterium]